MRSHIYLDLIEVELQIARAGVVAMRVIELKRDGGVPVGGKFETEAMAFPNT